MFVFEQLRTSDEKFWLMLDKGKVRWADTEKLTLILSIYYLNKV